MTQGSLGDGFSSAAASCSATDMRWACSDSHDRVDQLASSSCCRFRELVARTGVEMRGSPPLACPTTLCV